MRTFYFGSSARDIMRGTSLIRETFLGRDGDDVFHFYETTLDFSDRFIGGNGNDTMTGLNVGMNDYDRYADLSFDGGEGIDTVIYTVSDSIARGDIAEMDLSMFQTLERSVEHHQYNVSLSVSANASFTMTGTDGDESVRLTWSGASQADAADAVETNISLGGGNDRFHFVGDRDVGTALTVDTGDGDDLVVINDSTTSTSRLTRSVILTGDGDDVVVLEGMNKEVVKLGSGDDTVFLLSGSFRSAPDSVRTGDGADRIFVEIDEYATLGLVRDFDVSMDKIVFDDNEFRNTTVTFDAAEAEAALEPMLYMDNAADTLYFGDNVLLRFLSDVELTADNFELDTFAF